MAEKITVNHWSIMNAREMSKTKLERELGKYVKELEKLDMDHVQACEFVSSVMNIGIALQEKYDAKKSR